MRMSREVSSKADVDLSVDPETTNIKLVARRVKLASRFHSLCASAAWR